MTIFKNSLRTILAVTALAGTFAISSCAGARVGTRYRVYDPYRRDYHQWDADEGRFYTQWTIETRRDGRREFRKLNRRDQELYWRWRHDRR